MNFSQFLRARHRLLIAAALGVAIALVAPSHLAPIQRLLVAWNVFAWTYIVLVWVMMLRADESHFSGIARGTDEKAVVVLSLVSAASVMSLMAIFLEFARAGAEAGTARAFDLSLTGSTVVGSWLLVPTAFALHYAHLFYEPGRRPDAPPLIFPDRDFAPNYWDFMYFSFTIAVAAQTADVNCASRSMRKTVLAQALLSFVFNTSILALMVNIAATLAFAG